MLIYQFFSEVFGYDRDIEYDCHPSSVDYAQIVFLAGQLRPLLSLTQNSGAGLGSYTNINSFVLPRLFANKTVRSTSLWFNLLRLVNFKFAFYAKLVGNTSKLVLFSLLDLEYFLTESKFFDELKINIFLFSPAIKEGIKSCEMAKSARYFAVFLGRLLEVSMFIFSSIAFCIAK